MKKFYFTLVTFLFLAVANAQIVNIPDANFKAKLLAASPGNQIASTQTPDYNGDVLSYDAIDTNEDGEIQISEAAAIKYIDISNVICSSLEGIVGFPNLSSLKRNHGLLSNMNVSGLSNLKTLICTNTDMTSINLTGLTSLLTLKCNNNQLTNINLDGLINLKELNCQSNQLLNINFSGINNLEILKCNDNQLININLNSLINLHEFNCSYNQLSELDLSGLINLQKLYCAFNLMVSLDLNNFISLKELNCSDNQLNNLNLDGLINLEHLVCSNNLLTNISVNTLDSMISFECNYNQLSNLNVGGLSNLAYVFASFNQLTFINLSGVSNLLILDCNDNQLQNIDLNGINLNVLSCQNNQLSSLDVSNMSNLFSLDCYNNQIPYLNLSSLTSLQVVNCNNNLLTSLDVSSSSNLIQLACGQNQLTTIFIKNKDINWSVLYFEDNPSLMYICADESDIVYVQNIVSSYGYSASCQVNSYCSFTPGGTYFTIQGNNTIDVNNNGCDTNDSVYPNLKFNITNGTVSGSLISNVSGNYSIPVSAGTHTITPKFENPTYFISSPTSLTVTFPATSSPFTQNFCIVPNGAHHDLEVVIIPIDDARPGSNATYKIKYKNKGNQTENTIINFNYNDAVLDLVSSNVTPTTQTAGTLSWNVGTISPFQSGEILVTLNVNSPMETPAVNGGDVLNYTATANGLNTDETPDDNTFTLSQQVFNSFDPNDKTCLEGTIINPSNIGKYVHYKIRFENTGTFAAQNIVVKDMIDTTKFDLATLQMTDASHSCVTRITNPNKVEFIFENINLPFDDANNDGYVVFKIKTKPTLVVGNTISNSANIYFDYNFPIVTNTATSTFSVLQNDTFEFDNYFTIYPNPVDEVLNLNTKQATEIYSLTIYNLLGQQVQTTTNPTNTVDVSSLKTGNYIVKVVTDKGVSSSKFVKE